VSSEREHISMADEKVDEQQLGGTAIKPKGWDRTGLEAFKYMLYNPDTGEVLTRTPLSWLLITVFYVVYYCFLAGFWIGCLNIFFLTLPEVNDGPRWKTDNSIIGANPGLGLRPHNNAKLIDSQMFVLEKDSSSEVPNKKGGEGDTNADYAERMRDFLHNYNETQDMKVNKEKYKVFNTADLGDCENYPYGYLKTGETEEVAPCIFLKLNSIWDWKPVAIIDPLYKNEKMANEELPASLKTIIKGLVDTNVDVNKIWVDCEGRYPADREAFEIEYFPKSQGFPIDKFFPFTGKSQNEVYQAPLIAIKVTPKVFGQLIHIQCKAFYQNVEHVSKDRMGMVQFEVQVMQ